MLSSYQQLPSKFDYTSYYLNQAAGGPSFPIFRARQRGGAFLAPLLRRHGIPFLKWIGRQAASLATGVGGTYLDKGKVTKDDMKQMLKKQGKEAANSVLDKIKQQVGSGMMTMRRDARLGTLLPMTGSERQDGIMSNLHRIRSPNSSDVYNNMFTGNEHLRASSKRKKTRSSTKNQSGMNKLNAGLRKYLESKKKKKSSSSRKKASTAPSRKKKKKNNNNNKKKGTKSKRRTISAPKKRVKKGKAKHQSPFSRNPYNHTIFS